MSDTFHLKSPRKKHEENSPQGDNEAVRKGFEGSDHDAQKGASGISYNTHWKNIWERDGFRDPLHQYGPGTPHGPVPFDELPDTVIRRVVAHTNGEEFHIRSTAAGIRHAAKAGLEYVVVEAKPGNTWTIADFRHFKRVAKRAGIRLIIATMDNWPRWRVTLRNAVLAGCRVRRFRQG